MESIPKAEIHLHIEAAVAPASVEKMYKKRYNRAMTDEDKAALFSYSDLNGFIKSFLYIQNLYTSVGDFDLVFADFADYLVKNNITYCEAFFAPSSFLKIGMKYDEIVANFSRNIAEIKANYGITIKILVDVSRTFGCGNAMANYELFRQYPSDDFIGIGLGGAEQKGPAAQFAPVFEQAQKDGVHTVAHAGEDVGPESIWDTINFLHAERIGHGITAIQDKKLITYLKESRLPLEVCVTSNIFTKKLVKRIEEHPVRALYDDGVFITINTDDPVFFNTTLIGEYWKLYDKLNFSLDEIRQLIKNGYKSAFLSDSQKESYLQTVDREWEKNLPECSKNQ